MTTRSIRRTLAAAALTVAAVAITGAGVDAATRPKPAPAPSPAPAPAVIAGVTVPEANLATFAVTNTFELGVDVVATIAGPGDGVSGPYLPGVPPSVSVTAGAGRAVNLQPASSYVVTVRRHRFYDPATGQAVNVLSAPVSFGVTTLSLAQSRPSAPIISLGSSSVTGRQLAWAASTDNVSSATEITYTYSVVGDAARQNVPTCSQYCFGATGTTVARPAPGNSIRVTVTAIDGAGVRSLPSNEVVVVG